MLSAEIKFLQLSCFRIGILRLFKYMERNQYCKLLSQNIPFESEGFPVSLPTRRRSKCQHTVCRMLAPFIFSLSKCPIRLVCFSVFVADPSFREGKRKVSYPLRKISSYPAQFTEIIKGHPDVENTGNAQGIAVA